MNRHHHLLLALATTAIGGAGLVLVPASAWGAPTTCQGKPVTIVATTTVTRGTEGDDVVAMEPDAWRTFDALGGDDTICLAAGAAMPNDRDPLPPSGFLDAGAGDDAVVNLMPPGTTGAHTTVVLGTGDDSFQGADVGEVVHADLQVFDFADPYALPATFTGAQTDTVTGAATVFSAAPLDGPNQDRVTFGSTRPARLVWEGPLGPQGRIAFPAGGDGELEVRGMRRLASVAPSEVVVDNVARAVRVGSEVAFSWTGDVREFGLGTPRRSGAEPAVSFVGTDVAEGLETTDVPVGDVAMGGGDDALHVQGLNTAYVPRSADGGAGRDSLHLSSTCRALEVRLDESATCDGSRGTLAGFDDAIAGASWDHGTLMLVGTSRSERLVASAQQVRVRGRGGADEIGVDESYVARVSAGRGRDRVWASGDDVVVRGGQGRDRIDLQGSGGIAQVPGHHPQQVASGGRGNDVLVGTDARRGDRLLGGRGRDRADGQAGTHDLCRAEVTRRCERPRRPA